VKPVSSTLQAAPQLGVAPQTLRVWRSTGVGPAFCRVSANRVVYRQEDLETWLASKRRVSTSDPGPKAT
jgi:DNA-binding transcriptional MerR regulator